MNIRIETQLDIDCEKVWRKFDSQLFAALIPRFPPVKILRFDGCQKGHTVSLELNFLLFKNRWTSLITDSGSDASGYWFVDEGRELPFFLSNWRHLHRIEVRSTGCTIIDDIHYTAKGGYLLTLFWYLPLYMQFFARKKQYKAYFKTA